MNDIFRTEKEFYIIVFLFTVTLLLVIYLIRKTFLRLRKLDKDELIKERDKSLNKSSKSNIVKMILDLFS
ncbi:hypothetical protein SAMN05444377_101451 [Flavobacterium fontis]|uniref:Uncharacterized protein n=1 Tax=Flavobacterium fontis TaxID=1124188 RepID=A0A1M4WWY0_9FLAO|nr:hypothetical protein [Flavobacterium fontis]SHE85749.1 hypothetical protein SAMN05444377_101451 [Flavobacterium fontis]